MPIEVSCPSCAGHFRVPDSAAGKKIRCPKCKAAMDVPSAELPPAPALPPAPMLPPAPALPAAPVLPPMPVLPPAPAAAQPKPLPDEWYLQTADGEEYGPVSRVELDGWFAEGRITVDCQLLHGGQQQWQWAADVFPQLDSQPTSSGSQEPGASGQGPGTKGQGPGAGSQGPGAKAAKVAKRKARAKIPADADCSQRSRLVAGFLGIFLGPLGIHRFYLGYWGLGLAMLFTAGGLGLWSLIDAIFVMTGRVSDADGRPLSD